MRHVVVMTMTSSLGLVSVFFVDALNLFYISLLGQQALAAAIGYASTLMFFSVSIGIGMSIAASALVARAIGAEQTDEARRLASSSTIYLLILTTMLAVILYPSRFVLLGWLGAEGETLEEAATFMAIVIPTIPLLGLGMAAGALLRSRGDARRAMYVTLGGAVAASILDPLLIFGLDLGIEGAAWATVGARAVLALIGFHGVQVVHRMLAVPRLPDIIRHISPFVGIAAPALTTQLATPIGNAYVTSAIASFGDDAVAGWAIVGRLIPVAFGVVFALSGAVGPIMSQNYGARLLPRVSGTLRDAFIFSTIFCLTVWALLALLQNTIIGLFGATGDAASLVSTFCLIVAGSFIFTGGLFVSNATFNNLGRPFLATAINWGRATLGTFPFVYFGQQWGAEGVLIGWAIGGVVFGLLGMGLAMRHVRQLQAPDDDDHRPSHLPPSANSPFTSGKGATTG